MKIYFDIGNTNIKINLYEKKDKIVTIPTNKLFKKEDLLFLLPNIDKNKIKFIFICSVVPEKELIVKNYIKDFIKIKPIIFDWRSNTLLKLDDKFQKVGSDLIALGNLVASKTNNGIIVNLGSTITITHIKDQKFIGTIISLGITASLKSLVNSIAQIYEVSFDLTNKIIGDTTNSAIYLGLVKGNAKLIDGLVKEVDPNAKLFISGGDYYLLKSFLSNYNFINHATLEGMKIIEKFQRYKK